MGVTKVLFVTVLAGTLSIGLALFGQRWIDTHPEFGGGSRKGNPRALVLPDLRLPDAEGRQVGSPSWAGKVVVMQFWATWCTPCLAQIDTLEQLRAEYHPGVLQIVSIALDTPEDVSAFLATHPLEQQVLLGDLAEVELAARFGNRTRSLPFMVLFDHQGRVLFHQAGRIPEDHLRAQVRALLPETPKANGAPRAAL